VKDLIEHRISGSEFIVEYCDGKLTQEDICDDEKDDLCQYYVEKYLDDYFDFLKTNKIEVMDVVFSGAVLDNYVAYLEACYKKWRKTKA